MKKRKFDVFVWLYKRYLEERKRRVMVSNREVKLSTLKFLKRFGYIDYEMSKWDEIWWNNIATTRYIEVEIKDDFFKCIEDAYY